MGGGVDAGADVFPGISIGQDGGTPGESRAWKGWTGVHGGMVPATHAVLVYRR